MTWKTQYGTISTGTVPLSVALTQAIEKPVGSVFKCVTSPSLHVFFMLCKTAYSNSESQIRQWRSNEVDSWRVFAHLMGSPGSGWHYFTGNGV